MKFSNFRLLIVLVFAASFYFPSQLRAQRSSGNEEQALRQLENRWLQSEDDPSALQSILADDFVHALPMGFITKGDQIDYLIKHRSANRGTRHFEDLKIRVYGNVGIANGIVASKDEKGITRRTVFTDVFAYRNGRWQAVNAQENSLEEHTAP